MTQMGQSLRRSCGGRTLDDVGKLRVQDGAADERAVDAALAHVLTDVLRSDATAIEDARPLGAAAFSGSSPSYSCEEAPRSAA